MKSRSVFLKKRRPRSGETGEGKGKLKRIKNELKCVMHQLPTGNEIIIY